MSAQTQPSARKRTVHQLDTPFSTIQWPDVSQEDQTALLELLCSLLNPIGQHRATHVKPSRGRRARKAEQEAKASINESEMDMSMETLPPPPPDLVHHVDVGLNVITHNLQTNSKASDSEAKDELEASRPKHYAVVFVARGDQAAAFNCHFPKMVGAASQDLPEQDKIRLVGFSKSCSERLSRSLGVPRVSSIGISRDAPGAKGLLEMVARVVKPIEVQWLHDESRTQYLTTKINAIETSIGLKRQKAT